MLRLIDILKRAGWAEEEILVLINKFQENLKAQYVKQETELAE